MSERNLFSLEPIALLLERHLLARKATLASAKCLGNLAKRRFVCRVWWRRRRHGLCVRGTLLRGSGTLTQCASSCIDFRASAFELRLLVTETVQLLCDVTYRLAIFPHLAQSTARHAESCANDSRPSKSRDARVHAPLAEFPSALRAPVCECCEKRGCTSLPCLTHVQLLFQLVNFQLSRLCRSPIRSCRIAVRVAVSS